MDQRVLVFDNFYDNPSELRRQALELDFSRKPNATYPGQEAIMEGRDWSLEWSRLRSRIDEKVDASCPKQKPFPQGKFRLALAEDEHIRRDRAHLDIQRWSGIIYLTLPEDCASGVILYRNKHTGATVWEQNWFENRFPSFTSLSISEKKSEVVKFFADPDNFEEIGVIPMAYNRAILLMAHVFHGSGRGFGSSPQTGRLTQHFEFYW